MPQKRKVRGSECLLASRSPGWLGAALAQVTRHVNTSRSSIVLALTHGAPPNLSFHLLLQLSHFERLRCVFFSISPFPVDRVVVISREGDNLASLQNAVDSLVTGGGLFLMPGV